VGAYVAKLEGKHHSVCSGTLISPKVFLTAGHCTQVEAKRNRPAYVSFDRTYKPGASKLIKGTPYIHPKACIGFKEGCHRYDAGVVVLKEPVRMATYGVLPKASLVDTLQEGKRLTTVGYGATGFETNGNLVYPEDRYRTTVIIAFMVAYFVSRVGISGFADAAGVGALLWIFPAAILLGSVVHEGVPLALAAIHAGDWLVKLLLIGVVVGVWR